MTAASPVSSEPIGIAQAESLFEPFARFPLVALAVSGGPDSLALLHLVARWRAGRADGPTLFVLTVDHGLRAESAGEAAFVAQAAAALGLQHVTLCWEGEKPASGLAEAAREARYRLMCAHLAGRPERPRALVTAHTEDDQAETLLMRLARGSGVDGLAGMRAARLLDTAGDVTLLRPLLGVSKARLAETLAGFGATAVFDPTNQDLRFERPRLRALEALREQAGISNPALARTAARLARAADALAFAVTAFERDAVDHRPGLASLIARPAFDAAPAELRIRLLQRLLARHGGSHPRARLSEIERLADRLPGLASGTTLGGCRIEPHGELMAIVREPGRDGLPVLLLRPGETRRWDDRFDVTLAAAAPQPVSVRGLAASDRPNPRGAGADWLTGLVAPTAPAFWAGDRLVAAPSLPTLRHGLCTRDTDNETGTTRWAAACRAMPVMLLPPGED